MTKTKVKKSKILITKNDLIGDVIKDQQEIVEILIKYGLFCFDCSLSQYETVEMGAKMHGLSDREIEKMINEINNFLKKKKIILN